MKKRIRPFTVILLVLLALTLIVLAPIPFGMAERKHARLAGAYIQKVQPILRADSRYQNVRLTRRNWGGKWRTVDADGEVSSADIDSLRTILIDHNPPYDLQVTLHTNRDHVGLYLDCYILTEGKWHRTQQDL